MSAPIIWSQISPFLVGIGLIVIRNGISRGRTLYLTVSNPKGRISIWEKFPVFIGLHLLSHKGLLERINLGLILCEINISRSRINRF